MPKRTPRALILALLLIAGLFAAPPAAAQTAPLALTVERNFGYGGGSRIQGTFTMAVPEAEGLARVEFLIDDEVVFEDDSPPFAYRFQTGDFPPGVHRLSAVGYRPDGEALATNAYQYEFITAEAARESTVGLIVPLLAVVAVVTALGVLVPAVLSRGKPPRRGEYGMAGGAVCRRCGRPFSRHVWAPNLVVGKLERCPHCGKWAIVPRASAGALAEAEERWAAEGEDEAFAGEDEAARLRRAIEDSRFEE